MSPLNNSTQADAHKTEQAAAKATTKSAEAMSPQYPPAEKGLESIQVSD